MSSDILDREVKIFVSVKIEQEFELGTRVCRDQTTWT